MPDFLRIPIVAGYNLRLSQSIRIFLQNRTDSLNGKENEDAPQFVESITIPLPAITSKFPDMYNQKRELPETLDSLREEFREHRKVIVDWEKRMRRASLEEERKIRKEISSRIESLGSGNEAEIILNVVHIGEEFLTSGSFRPDTVAVLVSEGFKTFKRLLGRRNINYYYTGMKETNKIRNQHDLLNVTFGSSLTERQSQRFAKLAIYLNELITRPLVQV
jgi:hypothetical protein